MAKVIKGFFTIDLWLALTLITTMLANILIVDNKGFFITVTIACALVNAIFCVLAISSINFYKKKSTKEFLK